jgi:hypothetical protein
MKRSNPFRKIFSFYRYFPPPNQLISFQNWTSQFCPTTPRWGPAHVPVLPARHWTPISSTAFLQIDSVHPFHFHPWFLTPLISIPFRCLVTLNAPSLMVSDVSGSALNQLFEISKPVLPTRTNWGPWCAGGWFREELEGGGGLAKLKLCPTVRVRKGVGCSRCWSHPGRQSRESGWDVGSLFRVAMET